MPEVLRFAQKGLVLSLDGQSLLVSKYLTSKYLPTKLENKFCLPGGQLEWGQNPDESFISEIREETGITVTPLLPFYVWTWVYNKEDTSKQIIAIARLALYASGQIVPPASEKETTIDVARWMPIAEVKTKLNKFVIDEQPAIQKFLGYQAHNPFTPI
ncbi:hypothetical protein A2397_03280 [Candidatus Amesbacteria bacterium RIFOXYB1_FULL_44_23]|uniref:Nudix hydrolase domain-containing protein n=1 Tax=Candidatus Amesbacteria bacterium RIFOXYB1_FULL_44_23 TaxID=1797263 RepID=A0A1F4ZVS5_9BACT|nr:MAG: hypothetical protein A2397_03280 [Candidatus Amesbacteria bacterium RIFOXYB1_FULL_44_23]